MPVTTEAEKAVHEWRERGPDMTSEKQRDYLSRVIAERDEAEAKRKKLHAVLESVTESLELLLVGGDGYPPILPVGSKMRSVVEGAFYGVQEKIKEVADTDATPTNPDDGEVE